MQYGLEHLPMAFGLKWTQSTTCLGIKIMNDRKEMIETNFSDKLNKLSDILELWTLKKLTIRDKVLVINTLIIPQLLHLCTVMHMPAKYSNALKNNIIEFVWNKKLAKVKYDTLVNKIEYGGLKLQDIACKIKSLKIKWIKQLADEEYKSPWKTYVASKSKASMQMT